ncbi:MAG: hypothetical protein AMJ41_02145 [candidate division Zixibacteria bacterium DG_27]|nr:MAG: hypothetical protein AMJ41_02145 [candidate division Zixibacteria bacterium DG_27]
MRRQIPLLLTAIVGFVYIIQFFIPHRPFNIFEHLFTDWFLIIAACAIWLGVLNLLKLSLEKVYKRGKDWPYSVVTVAGFLLITIAGFFFSGGRQFQNPGTPFDYIYVNIFTPLSATMFALLAFFVASASYRAFRARTREATLLLLAGFFVMLGRVPVGDLITQWLPVGYRLSNLTDWIMNVPQTAGQRAIMIGIALGIMSTSLRVILGIERTITGGE